MHKYTLLYILIWLGVATLCAKPKNIVPDSLQVLCLEVQGVHFDMQRVEGGVFMMGGTHEQHREKLSTDLPTHIVSMDSYYIGTTEVTQALWKAVMPEWQFVEDMYLPNFPMYYVSWYDCQEFVRRLDSITGMPFRLPTEAEWEFAARGGNKSLGYRFTGGNDIDKVSWGLNNAGFRRHEVGQKLPNELGLYDMTGNVSEWCADWYAPYYIGTEPNPKGPAEGKSKVHRGSSFDNCKDNSYISHRYVSDPTEATNYCGLRLALSLSNEPTLQVKEEPELVKKVKFKNLRVKLVYVAAEEPYYISEEPISWRVWNKVMNLPNDSLWSKIVVDKTDREWNEFLEKSRRMSYEPLVFGSEEEVKQAIEANITQEPSIKKTKKRRWEKDTHSIQRHRRTAKKAQKWADLIGVQIKTTDDPTLMQYSKKEKNNQPRWLVIQ
jgi:formylglycine-generating enzyme required for sulfatase activity